MATEIKLRRGTTAEHASFTGVQGEITVDTDLNTIRVHDGQTASGHRVLLHSEFVGAGTGTVTQVATGTGLTGGPITASGTVSLEICKSKVPSIIVYKMNFINYLIVRSLVKVRFANIINIAAKKDTKLCRVLRYCAIPPPVWVLHAHRPRCLWCSRGFCYSTSYE